MPRREGRDYRAEYQARKARHDPNVSSPARRERAQRHGYRNEAEQRRAREAGRLSPRDPLARSRTTDIGGGPAAGGVRSFGSGSLAALRAELERAAAAGQTVAIRATFDAGRGPRTRFITGLPAGGVEAAGTGDRAGPAFLEPIAPGATGAGPIQRGRADPPVEIVSGPAGGAGTPAQDFLDWWDEYDFDEDPWAWLVDLWDDSGT